MSVTLNIVSAGSNCFAVESATHGTADHAVLAALYLTVHGEAYHRASGLTPKMLKHATLTLKRRKSEMERWFRGQEHALLF